MLTKILVTLAAVVAGALGFIASRPAECRVERSATVAAPPDVVFAQVNDFHAWGAWSPWAKRDPAMKTTFAGAPSGVGAEYGWAGNDDVGEGKMTISASTPGKDLAIHVEYTRPFPATNETTFAFTPVGDKTEVKWSMVVQNNFMMKGISIFMDMDKMVGKDFERGLGELKSVAEAKR